MMELMEAPKAQARAPRVLQGAPKGIPSPLYRKSTEGYGQMEAILTNHKKERREKQHAEGSKPGKGSKIKRVKRAHGDVKTMNETRARELTSLLKQALETHPLPTVVRGKHVELDSA